MNVNQNLIENQNKMNFTLRHVITGSYNNYFRTFKRNCPAESTYEASLELCKPYRQVAVGSARGTPTGGKKGATAGGGPAATTVPGRKRKEDISADFLDFNKKVSMLKIKK